MRDRRTASSSFALSSTLLDLEPDHGELVDDLVERRVGVEMLLQPGQGEFHGALLRRPAACALPSLQGRAREGDRCSRSSNRLQHALHDCHHIVIEIAELGIRSTREAI